MKITLLPGQRFPVLALGCKADARLFHSKTGHGPHSYLRPEEGKWFARRIVGVDCYYM